jgi:hypothetical protein
MVCAGVRQGWALTKIGISFAVSPLTVSLPSGGTTAAQGRRRRSAHGCEPSAVDHGQYGCCTLVLHQACRDAGRSHGT